MSRRTSAAALSLIALAALGAAAQDTAPPDPAPVSRTIRGMRYPSVSPDGSRLAFSYRGDLWTVAAAGGEAKRLAELTGHDVRPRWSPDGQTLAFSTDRLGNLDIYTVPAAGGAEKRITFHTADDVVADWTPDGKGLLFYASRDTRTSALYTIRLEDGRIRQLAADEVALQTPTLSPDGQTVAYVRGSAGWARKGYRGSAQGDVYTLALADPKALPKRLTATPLSEGWPMFSGDGKTLYYTSDADGTANLWRMPVGGGRAQQLTRQRDGYIHYPAISRDGRTLVYETDFSLWTVDLTQRNPTPQRLTITATQVEKPRIEKRSYTSGATEAELSPDGKWLALGIRGDIFLAPADGGEARALTTTPARDYDFVWSPDGKSLVFVSERGANQDLYLLDVESAVARRLTSDSAPEQSPQFSPDGRRIAFTRGANGKQVVTMAAAGGDERVVHDSAFILSPAWSPDGRWIAYTKRTAAAISNVYVVPAGGGEEINVSRWSGNNFGPVWSPDGQKITFYSSRSGTTELFTVDLQRPGATAQASAPPATGASTLVTVDATGLDRRIRPVAGLPAGSKSGFRYMPDGKAFLVATSTGGGGFTGRGPGGRGGGGPVPTGAPAAYLVPITGGTPTKIADGLGGSLQITPDGKTLYSVGGGGIRKVQLPTGAPTPVSYTANVTVDLAEERRETFDQGWRLLRDFFYDPSMHGVDWEDVRRRYRPIVDECVPLADFHMLLTEMVGELNASHMGVRPTAQGGRPGGGGGGSTDTALLGLWFDWNGDGPGLKVTGVLRDGPADGDTDKVRPGEWVLAIGGKDVGPNEAFWQALTGQAGKALDVLVNDRPDKNGARTVKLTPISRGAFTDRLYEHTVETNREKVAALSGGKFAYLHIRSMDQTSLARFDRELVTLAYDREGLVLDVRNNPGGRIHDDLFAILTRKVHAYETPRDALKMTQPFGAFTRPMILLINQGSFSDAEIFANGFRHNKLGTIVGVPTGGGVIGTGDLGLLDNQTTFRVPRTGWHTTDGRNLENWGVPPDLFVDLLPEDVAAGRDPQLETAVKTLLKQLPKARERR